MFTKNVNIKKPAPAPTGTGDASEDAIHFDMSIVSSSEQLCKRNTRSLAGCYFCTHFYIK